MKTFVIDIDGTLCTNTNGQYQDAIPKMEMIAKVNSLSALGHSIVLFTARGSTTGIDWRKITEKQLHDWGIDYHELILGKPFGDYYIDDKSLTFEEFINWSD